MVYIYIYIYIDIVSMICWQFPVQVSWTPLALPLLPATTAEVTIEYRLRWRRRCPVAVPDGDFMVI